jgi:anti-sigma B factor antagonist
MEIRHDRHDQQDILAIQGEVDLANAPDLRHRLRDLLENRGRSVVVDLSGVDYMDSSGIAVLIEGMRWAQRTRVQLVLAAPSQQVRMVMELAKLNAFFVTEPSVEQAIERLNLE